MKMGSKARRVLTGKATVTTGQKYKKDSATWTLFCSPAPNSRPT